jgi:hypothetical protein
VQFDPILDDTLAHLRAHLHPEWGDRAPVDVFGRLMAKAFGPTGRSRNVHMEMGSMKIRSRTEQWGIEKLRQLTRGHNGVATSPAQLYGPIVLVEYRGRVVVLDGNHRINTWVKLNDPALHAVNIHAVEGTAEFIELPSVP